MFLIISYKLSGKIKISDNYEKCMRKISTNYLENMGLVCVTKNTFTFSFM